MIAAALRESRRLLVEAGPAAVGAAVLVGFAALAGDAAAADPGAATARWPRETAPLVAALVACGPLAAARAGALARGRLEHQIDALRAMGGDVGRHLVAPRLLAGVLALPLLTLLADAAGLAVAYLDGAARAARWASAAGPAASDVAAGLARGAVFGLALAGVACVAGLAAGRRGGSHAPAGIARAAARAGAGAVVAVFAFHVALGGGAGW